MSTRRSAFVAVSALLFGGVAAVRLGDGDDAVAREVPSGSQCENEAWGSDAELGNPEMKKFLKTCCDEVEITGDNVKQLKNQGCQHQFDVVSWYNVTGVQQPSRPKNTGGIYCAKAYKIKPQPPKICVNDMEKFHMKLYAPVSGGAGPRPTAIQAIKDGPGLDKLQSNYTYFTGLHPRGWDSRWTLRKALNLCQKWNALDTVVEVMMKPEAAGQLHLIVGPSDASLPPTCGKKETFVKTKSLKALLCYFPVSDVVKAIDMQEIDWHPPPSSDKS